MQLNQRTLLQVSLAECQTIELSVPCWMEIAQPPANQGFIRHNVDRAIGKVPSAFKPPYTEHAKPFLAAGHNELVLVGARNAAQNLCLPAYLATKQPKLLRRVDEPWRTASYSALVRDKAGSLAIEMVRFRAVGPEHEPTVVEVLAAEGWTQREVDWAVVGQKLLWDGQLPPPEEAAGMTYDLRHLYRLQWERREGTAFRPTDVEIHTTMMKCFMNLLDADAPTRGKAICELAAKHGCTTEDAFYHSTIGIGADGQLNLLARQGSLADLGREHREIGSRRALLLDNGGSVAYAFVTAGDDLIRYVGAGTYFRPAGHALLVISLRERYVETPFRPQPE